MDRSHPPSNTGDCNDSAGGFNPDDADGGSQTTCAGDCDPTKRRGDCTTSFYGGFTSDDGRCFYDIPALEVDTTKKQSLADFFAAALSGG